MRNRLLKEMPLPSDGAARSERGPGKAKRSPARSVKMNLAESPLGWLKSRGFVSERQFEAGELLRRDWERAQLPPNVTMRWDSPALDRHARGPMAVPDLAPAQLAARRRFHEAVKAVGSGLADILWRVVCAGEGMRDAEQALGWPARAGRLVLAMALDRLADHYRLR